jgi:hypothetical protein
MLSNLFKIDEEGYVMVKRLFALWMIVVLLFLITACTQSEDQGHQDATTTTQAQTSLTTKAEVTTTAKQETVTTATTEVENPFAERMTITWLVGDYTSHLYEEGRWDELELEELFNVDLKMWNIDPINAEQVRMMLAAGDVPDYGNYRISGRYLLENGMGRTIPLRLLQRYYPSYYQLMVDDPLGLSFLKVEDKEDEYYGLALYTPLAYHTFNVALWRLDWLENIGYELEDLVPMESVIRPELFNNKLYFSTTKFPIADVMEIFRAFTEDDPDGNGVDDTYATNSIDVTWMFGFSANTSHFYKDPETGDYVPFFAYTLYRDSLQFSMDITQKGYMRSNPGVPEQEIWGTGKTGFMRARGSPRILGLGYGGDGDNFPPASILLNVDPDATFVITHAPGEYGKYVPYSLFSWIGDQHYTVGNITDEKLIRLFRLLEYAYFGENWMRYKFGIENIHYKWYGEPFKSPIIKTDPEKIPAKYAGTGTNIFGQFGNLNFIKDITVYFEYDAFLMQWVDYWENHGGYFNDHLWIRPDKFYSEATMTKEQFDRFKEIQNETNDQITNVRNDFLKKVNEGQIADLNAEWVLYIEQLYANGLDQWVEFWNDDNVKTYQYYKNLR